MVNTIHPKIAAREFISHLRVSRAPVGRHGRHGNRQFISDPRAGRAAGGGGSFHKDDARHPEVGLSASGERECDTSAAAADRSQGLPAATAFGWKRGLDICCVVISLPLVLPLSVLIALWIKLCSRGPALLRQPRIGRNGRLFTLYKFRSMKVNSTPDRQEAYVRGLIKLDRPMIKLDLLCDSRLILGGCLLRAAGLDELPQLLNVLRGEMSLVGPRPCLPGEYAYFSAKQRERFHALPGLTGIWQVNGKNRSTFREMIGMDIHYVRNASLLMDLRIMLRTPAALLFQMYLACRHRHTAWRGVALAEDFGEAGQGASPRTQHQWL